MTEQDLALLGIDAATIARVWTWGFGTVLLMWAFGYVVGVCVDLVKKA